MGLIEKNDNGSWKLKGVGWSQIKPGAVINITAKIMFIRNIKILGVIVMVKVRDILPLIQWNDAQIIKDQEEEICLLRNDFMVGSLSEEILNMTVTGIENDENIDNTVVVYVTDKED